MPSGRIWIPYPARFFVYFSKLSEQGERNKKPPALRVEGEKL